MASLTIAGSNVVVRNVRVAGYVLIEGDGARLDHVTATGVGISSASDVRVEHSDIGFSTQDAFHITSDAGRYISGVTLAYNYVHDPKPPTSLHYDGTQVRGADNVSITCSVYDAGPFQDQYNAAVYLENANGGDNHITVTNNWLYGSAWSFMVNASNVTLEDNQMGGDIHWGTCDVQATLTGLVSLHNTLNGVPIALCL